MKKILLLCTLLSSVTVLMAREDYKDYLEKAKEIIGNDVIKKPGSIDNVRETKMAGDRYQHVFETVITGSGRAVKESGRWWWPDSTKRLNVHHTTKILVIEDIKSSKEEIEKGIIKSEFYFQSFTERLGDAKGAMDIGFLSSEDFLKKLLKH